MCLSLQNTGLKTKIRQYEETCVCYPECTIGNKIYDEGQTWSEGRCVVCTCQVCSDVILIGHCTLIVNIIIPVYYHRNKHFIETSY